MSLVNKTCWVVGGVGVIGRGITRALLNSGATVIVNSREQSRLDRLSADLQHPDRLVMIHGSLLPGSAEATVESVLQNNQLLHHVVAHGAVRYWTTAKNPKVNRDETFSLNDANRRLLDLTDEEFAIHSSHLARLHFGAAKSLVPRLQGLSDYDSSQTTSYTFVTSDGGGHSSGKRSSMGELNSHHIWGLSSALRHELQHTSKVTCREIRVGLPVNRSPEEREAAPRERPLSEDIGDLCAALISSGSKLNGNLIHIDSQETLDTNLTEFATLQID